MPGTKAKSILFIEFPPAAGRPFTADEVVAAMSGDGYRILLIDGNLKKPCLRVIPGPDKEPGLADVLVGKLKAEAAVQPYYKNVDVLTAGTPSLNPDHLLASEDMEKMLETLSPDYDYILILSSAEKGEQGAAALAGHVSGTVIVAKKKATRTDVLRDYLASLISSGAHVLGAVFDTGNTLKKNAESSTVLSHGQEDETVTDPVQD